MSKRFTRQADLDQKFPGRRIPVLLLLILMAGCSSVSTVVPGEGVTEVTREVNTQEKSQLQPGIVEQVNVTQALPKPQPVIIEPARSVPARAQYLFEQSTLATNNAELGRAEKFLLELTIDFPEYASPHTNLGLVYMKTDRQDLAMASFSQAIEIEPRDCIPRIQMGLLERQRFNFGAAERAYLGCLERDENFAPAYLNLGVLYELYLGRWQEAIGVYERYQALKESPDRQVARWISVLERRAKSANQLAAGDQ